MATKYWKSTSSTAFMTAGNWSDGATPVNGDTLVFNHLGTANATDFTTGGTASTLTGITLIVEMSYTGQIGVLTASTQTYLSLDGGTMYLCRRPSQGSGAGPGLLMVRNTSTTAMTINVLDSASSNVASVYYPPILVRGTDITLNVSGGNVGVAMIPGETSTLTALRLTQDDNAGVQPQVTLGAGVTVTAMHANIGIVRSYADQTNSATTVVGTSIYDYLGTGAHTALDIADNAVCYYSGTGTATTTNVRGGELNCSRDARSKTFTTLNVYRGSTLDFDNGRAGSLTFTNPINYYDGVDAVVIRTPPGMKGSLTNI